jgi:NAD(P)-dependent dehydrogenase (short-subunit alcohol dehydrogenase family)
MADNTPQEFTGKTALVTGGAMGIGAAVATLLAERGANVAIVDRSREAAEKHAAELSGRGLRAIAISADL